MKKSPRIYYGWWVVGIGTALYAFVGGAYWTGFSFYFLPITRELGLSITSISLVLGLARAVAGLQAPIAGFLVQRFGARLMVVIGGAIGASGFLVLSLINDYLTFLLAFLGMVALGFSGGFDQAILGSPTRWFIRQRSRAMSLVLIGPSLGGALVAPIIGLLVINVGWRSTALISGLAIYALLIPASIIVRGFPEELGLVPDGGIGSGNDQTGEARKGQGKGVLSEVNITPGQGLRMPAFWILAFAMGLRVSAYMGLIIHFVPIVIWKGQTETAAALLISVYGITAIVVRIGAGFVGDYFSKQSMATYTILLGCLTLIGLLLSSGSLWQLVLLVGLLALADSSSVPAFAFAGDLLGRRAFAVLLGIMMTIFSVLSAMTPIVTGIIFDYTGTYMGALIMLAAMYGAGALLFRLIPIPGGTTLP